LSLNHETPFNEISACSLQVMEREVKDYSKPPMSDQGVLLNSAIDIPKRKEDLTESSEVCQVFSFNFVSFKCWMP